MLLNDTKMRPFQKIPNTIKLYFQLNNFAQAYLMGWIIILTNLCCLLLYCRSFSLTHRKASQEKCRKYQKMTSWFCPQLLFSSKLFVSTIKIPIKRGTTFEFQDWIVWDWFMEHSSFTNFITQCCCLSDQI